MTIVVMKRQFVVLCSGLITSCALHNRFPLGPSRRSEWRPLPPLRDWALTLLCAHSALLHWSSQLDALLCSPLPVSNRSLIVEEIFNNLITILQQHAPSQRQLPRHRQPVWWTLECFAACVAQWCVVGLQADPGSSRPQSLLRCMDPFPSDCQVFPEFFLVSLARSCCQSFPGEPTRCRQRSSTHFPPGSVPRPDTLCPLAGGQDPLEQWRQRFMSVGARSSSSFDPPFHADVMRKFADLCAIPPVPGVFDSPFTTSELRCALSRCVESAVSLDGLSHSLYKVMFPWWQSALVKLFNLVLAWGAVPSLWKHSIVIPSRPGNFHPVSLVVSCCLKVLEHLIRAYCPIYQQTTQ